MKIGYGIQGLAMLVTALLMNSPALANVQPGWDRPISMSQMNVQNFQGSEGQLEALLENSNTKATLILTEQDGSQDQGFSLMLGEQKVIFQKVSFFEEGCSLRYEGTVQLGESVIELKLIDNSGCDVRAQVGDWQATIRESKANAPVAELELCGNPEAVFTSLTRNLEDQGIFEQNLY